MPQLEKITRAMKQPDLKSMTLDQLWTLHEQIASALARKIAAEKILLDQRLRQLTLRADGNVGAKRTSNARRDYPQVFPKYRNPEQPYETWAGRGKQPRWLVAQLRSGKKLDDFRIQRSSNHVRRSAK